MACYGDMRAECKEFESTENGETIDGYAVSRPDRQFALRPIQRHVKVTPVRGNNKAKSAMIVIADCGRQMNGDVGARLFIA